MVNIHSRVWPWYTASMGTAVGFIVLTGVWMLIGFNWPSLVIPYSMGAVCGLCGWIESKVSESEE